MHERDYDRDHFLNSFSDPEERAWALISSGLAGHPDYEEMEAQCASLMGGVNQAVLACMQKPLTKTQLKAQERKFRKADRFLERCLKSKFHRHAFEPNPYKTRKAYYDAMERKARQSWVEGDDFDHTKIPQAPHQPDPLIVDEPRIIDPFACRFKPISETPSGGYQFQGLNGFTIEPAKSQDRNPFIALDESAVRPEVSLTCKHAVRFHNAIAFAQYEHEAIMTSHVIILWQTYGVFDHRKAAKILSEYLNEARKWAKVGMNNSERRRRYQRAGKGVPFRYVYLHENGQARGFHTHILCTVPTGLRKSFQRWSYEALQRLTRHQGHGKSIRVVSRHARTEQIAVQRSWNWSRYLLKQLPAEHTIGFAHEVPVSLRQILKPWSARASLPIHCSQICGSSQDLSKTKQAASPFHSQLSQGDLSQIYSYDYLRVGRHKRYQEKMQSRLNF